MIIFSKILLLIAVWSVARMIVATLVLLIGELSEKEETINENIL